MAFFSLYTQNFTGMSSNFLQIPQGARNWCINAISGAALVNGQNLPAPNSIYGGFDGKWALNIPITVVSTGASYVFVSWAT
jgi:hypothetical protein